VGGIHIQVLQCPWCTREGGGRTHKRLTPRLVKNEGKNNFMRSESVADCHSVGGIHQTGAQYKRHSIVGLWRVFDVLNGGASLDVP
jgi:hypothetical protein